MINFSFMRLKKSQRVVESNLDAPSHFSYVVGSTLTSAPCVEFAAHLKASRQRMVKLRILANRNSRLGDIGRFRLQMSSTEHKEWKDVYTSHEPEQIEWKDVYTGREPEQIVYNLVRSKTYSFRACRISMDGKDSEWSNVLAVTIPRHLKRRKNRIRPRSAKNRPMLE